MLDIEFHAPEPVKLSEYLGIAQSMAIDLHRLRRTKVRLEPVQVHRNTSSCALKADAFNDDFGVAVNAHQCFAVRKVCTKLRVQLSEE